MTSWLVVGTTFKSLTLATVLKVHKNQKAKILSLKTRVSGNRKFEHLYLKICIFNSFKLQTDFIKRLKVEEQTIKK